MAEEPDEVDVSSDVRKDKRAGGGGGGIAVRNYRGSDEKDHVGSASSSGAGPKLRSRKVGTPRRYMDGDEDGGSASASGATEAMSEQFIPVGQATKKAEDRHHHQFVPSETVSRTAGKEVEVRHCDISGHEHKDCWACNRGDGRGHDESCHADKVQVIRSVSVKKALRVIAPAGMVEGRKAWSSSTSGGRDRLLLSTAPAESMDGLRPKGGRGIGVSETESSDWAPSPRNPNASFSSELDGQGRTSPSRRRPTRRSKQKTKRVDPNSVQNHTSTVNEGVASNYSYQLPQTHLSMIARARSKETLEALRSYRRMSELPYLPEDCSICATRENPPSAQLPSLNFKKRDRELELVKEALLKQEAGILQSIESIRRTLAESEKNTKGVLTEEQSMAKHQSPDDNQQRQVPSFQDKMQAAAAGKKRESEMLESQLRKQLHDTQEKLREVQEQGQQELEPAVDSLDSQEDPDKSQGFEDLQAECDYLRKEMAHMKRHLELSHRNNDHDLENQPPESSNVCKFNPGQEHLRLESAQKLVTELRSTLEESQKRLSLLEQSHERHEDELQMKMFEMQDREAHLLTELHNVQEQRPDQGPNNLLKEQSDIIHDGQKELAKITNQLHLTTKELEALRMEYASLTAFQEQCHTLSSQVEKLKSELDQQKELTRHWKEESEAKERNLITKEQKLADMGTVVLQEQASSQLLKKEVEEFQKNLKSRELIVSELEKELQQLRECLSSKELATFKLEKDVQQHRESLNLMDQTVADMEKNLQHHRQSLAQNEEKAHNLQKDLERAHVDLQESHKKYNVLEENMKKEAEKDKIHLDEVKTELSKSKEKLNEVLAQLETRSSEEMQYRKKSAQDLQKLQEELRSAQAQLDEKVEEEKKLRRKSAQDLQDAQEQLRALRAQLDEKSEEDKAYRRKSVQDLYEAQEQLESLQSEMGIQIEKERNLRKDSLMDLQQAHQELKESKKILEQVEKKADEEKALREKAEKELQEAQERFRSLQEHANKKDEEEKHFRKQSIQDLQEAQEKLRAMQQEHRRQSTISEEKMDLVQAQQKDLVEQLEIVHEEKRRLELDNEQALEELELIKKGFAGLQATLAKHDLCVDFVEDLGGVLIGLHNIIDKHKKQHQRRREEKSDYSEQGVGSKTSLRSSKAGKLLKDLNTKIEDQKKRKHSRRDERSGSSEHGSRSKGSRLERSSLDTTDIGFSDDFTDEGAPDFRDVASFTHSETPKTEESGGAEAGGEEEPSNAVELKEELEDNLDDVLETLGVDPDSEGMTDETYQKLLNERFQRKLESGPEEVDLLDTINMFSTT